MGRVVELRSRNSLTDQNSLINNYINPIIGDMEVQAVTPRVVDGYIQTLQKTASVSTKTRKATTTYVKDVRHTTRPSRRS